MRKIPILALVALAIVQLACARSTAVRRQERATATAAAALTATAQALVQEEMATPTPECKRGLFTLGCGIDPREPTPTKTPLPTPTHVVGLRTVTTRGNTKTYHDYYEDPSDSRKLGVISGNLQLTVVSEMHDGRYLQVLLTGTMEVNDLGFEGKVPQNLKGYMGETSCIYHTWGHASNKRLCHAHFWRGDDVTATIPEKLDYVIDSESVVDQRVQVRIIQLVWINGSSVK
jgi:hypothetical protein